MSDRSHYHNSGRMGRLHLRGAPIFAALILALATLAPPAPAQTGSPIDGLTAAVQPLVDAAEEQGIRVSVGLADLSSPDGQTAIVHMLLVRGDNEVVLFNTWERNDPIQIVMDVGYTLPGIFEGIQGMNVGGMRVISMPPDMAFGPEGESQIVEKAAAVRRFVGEAVEHDEGGHLGPWVGWRSGRCGCPLRFPWSRSPSMKPPI